MLVHNPDAILHIRNDVLQSPVFPQQSIIQSKITVSDALDAGTVRSRV
jgi:hypothetical protein